MTRVEGVSPSGKGANGGMVFARSSPFENDLARCSCKLGNVNAIDLSWLSVTFAEWDSDAPASTCPRHAPCVPP
jgi:hypothetical protein